MQSDRTNESAGFRLVQASECRKTSNNSMYYFPRRFRGRHKLRRSAEFRAEFSTRTRRALRTDVAGRSGGHVASCQRKAGEVVYDLGCGDGRIVITAVREYRRSRCLRRHRSPTHRRKPAERRCGRCDGSNPFPEPGPFNDRRERCSGGHALPLARAQSKGKAKTAARAQARFPHRLALA